MLYNTNKGITMLVIIRILLIGTIAFTSSCAFLAEPLDKKTGFSTHLQQIESSIRNDKWQTATTSLESAKSSWKKIKPLMQVDIDHDYVKSIEDGFEQLEAYLYTKNKANSLASVLLIKSTWRNIGSF